MPSLQDVIAEVQSRREESPQDNVLKKYLKRLYKYTKRPTILYVSAFTESEVSAKVLQLGRQDASCFMAAAAAAESRELDLILHSPGGTVEAAEQIVTYLRRRFVLRYNYIYRLMVHGGEDEQGHLVTFLLSL